MRYLSLFSGIEAASCAWEPMGWTPVAFAEIEPFPCSLLAQRWPGVPNLGDVRGITRESLEALGPIDVVIGGSPCQDLSVAGKRAGLAGDRSGLFNEQVRIWHDARSVCGTRWMVWENVPGVFSSHGGRDFAAVVGALAGCEFPVPADGWGSEGVAVGPSGCVAWSVLDAQWFGVAQRRRRVFVVVDAGDWTSRPPVLLEPESLRGDHPPRRATAEGIAGCVVARTGGGLGTDLECDGGLIPEIVPQAMSAKWAKGTSGPAGDECANLVTVAFDARHSDVIQYGEIAGPLDTDGQTIGVQSGLKVRRLTPTECERLQGFPDGWTAVAHRGKPAADGPRYRALGNSMAVPVIAWIGRQIERAHTWRAEA